MSLLVWCFVAWAVSVLALTVVACLASERAYRSGFWDGVCWERTREGRVRPEHDCELAADSGTCVACHLRGSESLYPSKPHHSWHGWESLSAAARQRAAREQG